MLCPSTYADATPAKEAWARASPMNDSPFQTTNAPTTAHSIPIITVAASARCMKASWNGSRSAWPSSLMVRAGVDGEEPPPDLDQAHPRSVRGPEVLLGDHL